MLRKWVANMETRSADTGNYSGTYFGLPCIHWVYFLQKYTELHDMWMKCQRIKTSHSFLTVLIISNILPAISWFIAPLFLPDCFTIAPQFLSGLLNPWCRTFYLPQSQKMWTLLLPFTAKYNRGRSRIWSLRKYGFEKLCYFEIDNRSALWPHLYRRALYETYYTLAL